MALPSPGGDPTKTHYVVAVDIKLVSTYNKPNTPRLHNPDADTKKDERVVEDVTHVVVRAESIEAAVAKINGILAQEVRNDL